jgi:hypothetical protein
MTTRELTSWRRCFKKEESGSMTKEGRILVNLQRIARVSMTV